MRREGMWISFIAHLLLFWFFFYGPKFRSHQLHVVNPNDNKAEGPDVPESSSGCAAEGDTAQAGSPSDKNRIAQAQKPTIDRKTLQQLEAMRRAGPPLPSPSAGAPASRSPPPAPTATGAGPSRDAATGPKPAVAAEGTAPLHPLRSPQPSFDTGPQSAGDAIRQAARDAARNPGASSGDYGQNAPSQHSAMAVGPDIISDTMGVDFGPYMSRVIAATYRSWLPIIPESARPPLDKQGRVGVRFKIYPDGSVKQMTLEFPSGDVSLDRAAWGGITGASPYPPLPKEFKGPFLELRFGFYYNLDPEKYP